MAKRKGQTPKHKQHLTRVRRFIAAAEKRGYRFDSQFKAELYGYSTQKLKGLTPEKLYKKATAISEKTGKPISGTKRRKEEFAERSRKAAATRRRKQRPYAGILIMTKLVMMMNSYNTAGSEYLKNLLTSEIKKHGRQAVLKALDEVPEDVLKEAEIALIYEEDHESLHRSFKRIADIINQTAPRYDTSVKIGKTIDKL